MRGKFAHAKVEHKQLQLGGEGQAAAPDVARAAPPQLHGAAGPAVLLLAVREEARRQLRACRVGISTTSSREALLTAIAI